MPGIGRWGEALLAVLLAAHLFGTTISALERTGPGADLPSYLRAAHESRWVFDTGIREPLFPLLIRLLVPLFGSGLAAGRAAAVLSTFGLAALLYALARRLGGPIAALGAGLAFATTPTIPHYAAAGDRGALVALLLLAWAWASFEARRPFGAAAGAGALLLARLEMLGVILLGAAVDVLMGPDRRGAARRQAIALSGAVLLAAPYVAHLTAAHGDPFHPQAVHARYWANLEFIGGPGFPPDRAAFEADPYVGGPLSPARYVFGMHTPADVVGRYARGLARALAEYLPAHAVGHAAVYLVALAGAAAALRRRPWIPLLAVAALLPFSFVYTLDQAHRGSGVEARLVLHAAPIVHLLAGLAASAAFDRLRLEKSLDLVGRDVGRGVEP